MLRTTACLLNMELDDGYFVWSVAFWYVIHGIYIYIYIYVCVCVCVCAHVCVCVCVCVYIYIYIYIGCHRRNGPNFGRVFLMLNYTDITQNTYIQS